MPATTPRWLAALPRDRTSGSWPVAWVAGSHSHGAFLNPRARAARLGCNAPHRRSRADAPDLGRAGWRQRLPLEALIHQERWHEEVPNGHSASEAGYVFFRRRCRYWSAITAATMITPLTIS